MPVARNTWQPRLILKPASAARRRIDARRHVRQYPGSAGCRAEEGGLAVLADAGGSEILIDMPAICRRGR